MRILGIYLLLLVVVTIARNVPKGQSFPDDLYPAKLSRAEFKSICPRQSSRIDYCVPQYKECIGKLTLVKDCGIQFCSCLKISESDEDTKRPEHCDHDACSVVHLNGNLYKKIILEDETKPALKEIAKKLKKLFQVQSVIVKDCDIEAKLTSEKDKMRVNLDPTNPLQSLTLPFFAMANVELPKTEECMKAHSHYLDILEEVDSETSKTLKIPYNIWFIGAEFGPIGRVVSRLIADELCDKSSSEFNHYSVIRVNCYDQQSEKSKCDEHYLRSMKRTLSTLDSKKVQCKMFLEFIEGLQRIRSDTFYKEAAGYHVDASKVSIKERVLTKGFKADNQSLTQRDTKTTLISFESTEQFPPQMQQAFENVSSDCSNSRNSADIVASCGFRYGQCVFDKREQCSKQLLVWLSDIPQMNEKCENAISIASGHLWPSTPPTEESKVASVQSIEETPFWRTEIIIGVAIVCVCLCCACLKKVHSWWTPTDETCSETTPSLKVEDLSQRLISPAESETSSSDTDTTSPSVTSNQILPSALEQVETDVVFPDLPIELGNDENIGFIQTERSNNQTELPDSMKTDVDSVANLPV